MKKILLSAIITTGVSVSGLACAMHSGMSVHHNKVMTSGASMHHHCKKTQKKLALAHKKVADAHKALAKTYSDAASSKQTLQAMKNEKGASK